MSIQTDSTRNSLSWFEIFTIAFGVGIMMLISILTIISMTAIIQSWAVASSKTTWFISRSSGILAYLLLTMSVSFGLMQSGSMVRSFLPTLLIVGLHNFLSWASLVMVGLHALILLGSRQIGISLANIFIPFSYPDSPILMGIGVLSIYLMVLIILSFYIRQQIGTTAFIYIHYSSYLLYVLVSIHSLGSGTDSLYLMPFYALSVGLIINLSFWRFTNMRSI